MVSESWLLFFEGMMSGLMLTIMIGPITMLILRHSIAINRTAGVLAAAGTWVSDFCFISVTFLLTLSVTDWTAQPGNKLTIYLIGGIGLMIVGFVLAKAKRDQQPSDIAPKFGGYLRAFGAGFMVNSLSPFTLFFWLGVAALVHLQSQPAGYFYAGVMLTIGIGDFLKAWYAPLLMRWLKEHQVYWVQVVAGLVIAATGLFILGKGIVEYFSHT